MEQFKPNSHKSKRENVDIPEKKVERVTSGAVKTKKRSDIRKFTDVFLAEDMDSVKTYVVQDVLIPTVKTAIVDIVTNGINMFFFGDTNGGRKSSTASKVSYRSYYDKRDDRRDYNANRTRTGYSYDDIYLDNRGEAEEVLARMDELVATYGMVSVADLYDLVGVTGNYTDNKYGWNDIRSASIIRNREGYKIKLPKALPLD